ncbi:RNA-binding ribosome biosynthesis protein MAK21 [Aspergillus chevalieri]|uniref:CCAAT-binding factor domain-containing protein n=1 Tax=Aspergillus chevalieri TaxID=182096 RepID=A0A7R7VLJ6_ASPCH|nr:uncharacterized protein ACHE_30125A [Aspergillus chevalieri]BCR86138.1 hypothetical protein ACHE_30125A [Aspergillus chevalieri]
MAKNNNKGKGSAIPDGGVALNDSNVGGDSLPNFEENAFAGLRQKIEQKLKDQNSKSKNKGKGGAKDAPKNDTPKKDAPAPKNNTKNESAPRAAPKQEPKNDNKGKKRDRNGDVIAREEKSAGKDKVSKASDDTLRQEILALGGTEEDLDLVAGVESEDEVEDVNTSKKSGKKSDDDALRKELSSMLAAAGQVVPEDLKDDEVEEEQEEEADDDEEEEGDGDDESDEQEEAEEEESDAEEEASPEPSANAEEYSKETKKEPVKPEEFVVPKEFAKLVIPPRSDWYATSLPSIKSAKLATTLPRYVVDRLHEHALSLLEKDTKMYNAAQQASASSSHKFYSTIMASGTLSDKISALTLAVQESPVHNTKALETLVGLGKKRSRAQAVEVLRSLKDMFAQGTLLPNDRRLRSFANQPSLMAAFQGVNNWTANDPLPNGLQNSHLILWAYENFLKDQYFEVLKILEVWCNDEIEFSRSRALSYVYELLKEKPEQEANLLRLLVNKLGDPSKKIASRASYLLLQLEQVHPLMKPTVVTAVEEVLFRPGQSQHAKYYGIITLNQTVLSLKEEKTAVKLLDIYFALFVTLLKSKKPVKSQQGKNKPGNRKSIKKAKEEEKGLAQQEEMQDKLVSGVLTGVNRAYPFTSSDTARLAKHIDTLFRITHSSNFNTSIQALMLIQQLTSSHQVGADRFYRTLYESLLDPRVATSSKQALYLNLLFKALKNDVNIRRVKAFVKRLVQILGMHQPSFICGIFYLIRELEKTYSGLQTLLDQPEENESDDEEVFRDVPDEDDEPQQPEEPEVKPQKPQNVYDPRKRDPEHSNADKTCLWELLPYMSHFHPSVSVNAAHLLDHQTMSGKPDLSIHTLSHFLDRFIYRTPKADKGARGSSIMQPLAGGETADRFIGAGKAATHVPLNSEAFWKKKADEVAAEDVFFHEYFNRVGKDKEKSKARSKKDDKDPVAKHEEDGDLSDNEDEIWKALVDSRPELEDGDSDDDLDMDDLESAYDAEENADEGSGDEGVIFNDESDKSDEEPVDEDISEPEPAPKPKSKDSKKKDEEPSDEDDDFDMDVSDDDAFVGSDEELPMDMGDFGEEEEEEEEKPAKEKDSKKRRKLKHLPTFASADDYAALLAGEDDGM